MSKTFKNGLRRKPTRDLYVNPSPYGQNKRRKSLTNVRSLDDTDISYRSTSDYLRQLMNTSVTSTKTFTRTNSANESLSGPICKVKTFRD